MPQVFLAAAHDDDRPLPALVAEIRAIEKLLSPLEQQQRLQVLSQRAANTQDIFDTFSRQPDIQIFHYAGHADEQKLYLEEDAHVQGMAELFGLQWEEPQQCNKLRLTFINGCASKGQVASLHAAGIPAVIATSRPIDDHKATLFAEAFYTTWALEGNQLQQAFEVAKARLHTKDSAKEIVVETRDAGWSRKEEFSEELPWGLYLHPDLEDPKLITDWVLNERPKLPDMLLASIKPSATMSLKGLIHDFIRTDKDAKHQVRNERKEPVMVLIERLPWTIGTHLRRLFAVEADKTMLRPGKERLKELISAYSDLTRFISYLTLSTLWDSRRKQQNLAPNSSFAPLPFTIVPNEDNFRTVDYTYRTRVYADRLQEIKDYLIDPIGLMPRINGFIDQVDQEDALGKAYQNMEGWKQAVAVGDQRLEELIASRSAGKAEGLKELVLEAEAIYARFLNAVLFLTEFKLHTLRSISVEKFRNLEGDQPYSHYTISLHAAFSQLQNLLTERETASDNYCLLLTRRIEKGDVLKDAVNLSPFYVDRSSYISNNTRNYPAVFTLDYKTGENHDTQYVFHYIDTDVNHNYAFEEDHELVIDQYQALLPDHLEIEFESLERFGRIHRQIEQMEQDIPQSNSAAQ